MLIISNFNLKVPNFLLNQGMEYIIYDQSNQNKYREYNKNLKGYYQSKHTGHNLSDYFRYIVDNYDNLPEIIRFIKGNIVPRHCDEKYFLANIKNNFFTGLYNDKIKDKLIFSKIQPGVVIESNVINIFRGTKECRYFRTCNGLLNFLFESPINSIFIPFIPGGCFIVEKERILRYPKSFYKLLYFLVSYTHFPQEAYIVERLLFVIFNGNYQLVNDPKILLENIINSDSFLDNLKINKKLVILFKLSKFLRV